MSNELSVQTWAHQPHTWRSSTSVSDLALAAAVSLAWTAWQCRAELRSSGDQAAPSAKAACVGMTSSWLAGKQGRKGAARLPEPPTPTCRSVTYASRLNLEPLALRSSSCAPKGQVRPYVGKHAARTGPPQAIRPESTACSMQLPGATAGN